jgi:hypothetical protein
MDVGGLLFHKGLPTTLIEVEVKVSKSDLRHDFSSKHFKHLQYKNGNGPSFLYYAIPVSLKEVALEVIPKANPSYGIMVYREDLVSENPVFAGQAFESVHRAKRLNANPPDPAWMNVFTNRMMNEYLMLKLALRNMPERIEYDIRHFAKDYEKSPVPDLRGEEDTVGPARSDEALADSEGVQKVNEGED